ncbi:c-type heme family protein [Hymenobacter metallicola]|uniref:DUF3365 domain-containing protein n=1 Tax=Hymenobacter metallicola TaxID=2563114 RepID=A0A4Z0QCD9_9BACT|nr:DUF3365 domain-containing protein [Hymenobacter metallicola]TGE26721.1 DUF3365 domain-containing protein [Hymenobacter metallicola]
MRFTYSFLAGGFLALNLLASCRPDQIEHIENGKQIATTLEKMAVKRILPADFLHATRWAGDSLTGQADRELRRLLAQQLRTGGVAAALPFCRPEAYASTDSLAHVLQATARRLSGRPRNVHNHAPLPGTALHPDTARLIQRPTADLFVYQRPILLADAQCLRCHGEVGKDISAADYALIKKQYPQDQATGYKLGDPMGVWRVTFTRNGVADFYTMKTRKVMKTRKPLF